MPWQLLVNSQFLVLEQHVIQFDRWAGYIEPVRDFVFSYLLAVDWRIGPEMQGMNSKPISTAIL